MAMWWGLLPSASNQRQHATASSITDPYSVYAPGFPCPFGSPGSETQGSPDSISFTGLGGLCAQLVGQEGSGSGFCESGAQETKETGNINPG